MKKLALLVPLVLALAVAACNSGSESTAGSTGGGRDVSEGSVEAGAGGAGSKAYDGSAEVSAVPQVGPQIVKTASLGLGIAHGSFDDKVGQAHAVADSFGGFVVQSFASQLGARTGLPVALQDERLTSVEAESRLAERDKDWRSRKKRLDAAAAAIILQDHLDGLPR